MPEYIGEIYNKIIHVKISGELEKNQSEVMNSIINLEKETNQDQKKTESLTPLAADFKYKDILYDPSFWSSGINYNRIDYNHHY